MLITSSCMTTQQARQIGRDIGLITGGILGTNIGKGRGNDAAIIIGSLLGSWIGEYFALKLNEQSEEELLDSTEQSLNDNIIGRPHAWGDPDEGLHGVVISNQMFYNAEGQICRKFENRVSATGKRTQTIEGLACRDENGSWKII